MIENIAFPVLGENLHVRGLTLERLEILVHNKLINGQLIGDLLLKVEILNFKISVATGQLETGF